MNYSDYRSAPQIGLARHLSFVLSGIVLLLVMYALLRLALLGYNWDQGAAVPKADLVEAFVNGVRFDLRLAVIAMLPLLIAPLRLNWMQSRNWMRGWLVVFASFTCFLGIVELDFYREFNQRLNGLVFQYMKEDPKTVMSMVWYGFPVVRYLLAWTIATALLVWLFRKIDVITRREGGTGRWPQRLAVVAICLMVAVVAGRGTLRQGSPLRWGDAFTTDSMFANQLGLNATLSLAGAAMSLLSPHRDNVWKSRGSPEAATAMVRKMLLTPQDTLVDPEQAVVRRDFVPAEASKLPVRNVVLILMESLAGHSIGALGSRDAITPYFDKLAEEGLLFTRFFSGGTHTHQGMFASIGCFPNLPGFEYLMQTIEGRNKFSGLPQLLGARNFDNVYVYNGDFAWDNQYGFFGAQGVTNFVGRMDFVNPVVFDPTWGVADEDMFNRAAEELEKRATGKPFYAILQTLSNHTPYPLPAKLPVEAVTGQGAADQHLTAMRYSDWALGQFFGKIRNKPFYKDTLFVIVGDHGFAKGGEQLTELNLARFHIPLLLIAPGIRDKFGNRRDTVGTQVDIVPTIIGRLGGKTRHQCWGRDLLSLPKDDRGHAMIKPSGGEQIVGMVSDDRIMVKSRATEPKVYRYQLGAEPKVEVLDNPSEQEEMNARLEAFIHAATQSLLDNTTGLSGGKR